jgi:hypothetical protein
MSASTGSDFADYLDAWIRSDSLPVSISAMRPVGEDAATMIGSGQTSLKALTCP